MTLSPAQSAQLEQSLRGRIAGEISFDPYQRALFSTDASIYRIQPLAVVAPKTRDDVAQAVKTAAEFGVPIISRGSGTSLSGQSIGAGIVLDLSRHLNRIVELSAEAQTARVEPGVVLDVLNAAAAKHGLQFGPDVATSSRANLGGMIGNNSAGARSIWQGKTVDHVIALDVVLADGTQTKFAPLSAPQLAAAQAGDSLQARIYRQVQRLVATHYDEIIRRFPKLLRRVSGYNLDEFVPECRTAYEVPPLVQLVRQRDEQRFAGADFNLAKLVVGAEGTLACVTEALVHLIPLPKVRGVVVLHFDSLADAVQTVENILPLRPSAVELLDGLILRLAEKSLEYRRYLDFVVGHPETLLLVEFSGERADEVRDLAAALHQRVRGQPGLTHILDALEPAMYAHVWACRKAGLPLLMAVPGARKPLAFVEDPAVDPKRLPEFVARFRELIARHDTFGAFYGHASVGCLHIRPMLDTQNAEDRQRLAKISREVCELVMEFDGAMSGEHGDGLARSYLNEQLFGTRLYGAFKELKAAFDPAGILNPGKVVDGPPPLDNLRLGPEYQPQDVPTTLDFSREGGLARAAEMCNGAGVCRKLRTGTMCPSFMVTLDEEHSTRGRANALRMVLSGGLAREEFTGRKLYDTFDLCLQCKGCKAECPSNVDVAKMKVEFLSHYYQANGTPLGVRAMGHVATLNRVGAALAPVSNLAARLPGVPWLMEKLLGVDRRRPLPTFVRNHFHKWFAARPPLPLGEGRSSTASRGPIVLLDDCLTSYCEPQVNQAAVEVLEAAGYDVHLAGLKCCGRALVSQGLLREAQELAKQNIQALLPWVNRGSAIVGCEPSCLLTLVDEYPDLVPGEESQRVAEAAVLIDSHLVRADAIGSTVGGADSDQILLHGHCHQKALVGTHATVAALKQAGGHEVTVIDSGCCGMAGSFGYEHYDMSMAIGERVLFPAVRVASPDVPILAPGFSCRHQILHGTGRRALHPIEWIAGRLT